MSSRGQGVQIPSGNYESRNGMERGTERGTGVRCGPRARLDWTHPKICKMPFSVEDRS